MRDLAMHDLGSLNENKKITAKFTKYEVKHRDNETIIYAVLEKDELPQWQEGYGVNGQDLLLSLCNLYQKIENVDDWEACHHIIEWCKKNTFPYYDDGSEVRQYDFSETINRNYWDMMVNVLDFYMFSLERITADLKKLYEDMKILLHFYNVLNDCGMDIDLPKSERVQKYKNIGQLKSIDQLKALDGFLLGFPKFPMELCIDEVGNLKILPGFKSVFEAAYYALARFVSVQPDAPVSDGGKTPLGICESCGNIFFKNGNRQKYCDDPECKKERNRRKSRTAYLKKLKEEK